MGISDRKRNIEVPVSINLDLNQEPKPNQFLIDNNIKGGSFVSRKKSGNVFAGSKLNVDGQGIYTEKNITPDLFKKLPKQTPVSEGNPPIPTQTPTNTVTPSITPTISLTPSITPTISLTPSITPTNTVTPSITPTNTPTPTNPCQNCIQVPVEIGTQIWDKCNLNVTTYSDGEPIPQVTGTTEWTNLTTGAWCHFDNDPANEPIYGKLYNGYALLGIYDAASLANPLLRKTFAPVGKRIPTNTEWNDLRTFLSGQTVAGGKMKEEGLCHWNTPNSGATNESGFTALGAGNRNSTNGLFGGFNLIGIWWSSTPQSSGLNFNYSVEYSNTTLLQSFALWEWGFSVRCLIDTPVTPTVTPTNTVTPTTTPTNTLTPTTTPTITPTNTVTPTLTITPTPTSTPPPPFISVWRTTSPSQSITLPYLVGGTYDGTIDWGDGTTSINSYANRTHTYTSPNYYTVTIYGLINGFRFASGGSKDKIYEVLQWGSGIKLSDYTFLKCTNLILTGVTDTLILSGLNNLSGLFSECSSITTINNINNWEVSGVTNMSEMFRDTQFNQPLSGWNVSNVIDMSGMFLRSQFNQPINNWEVSGVTSMAGMFDETPFDQPLSGWNVSNVIDMSSMFKETPFDQYIDNWNVSGVTNMSYMFQSTTSFNQPLSGWNVSNVNDMYEMFYNSQFNQPIGNWDVSNVTNMYGVFSLSQFNQNIGNWNISGVTNFNNFMFGKTPSTFSTTNLDSIYNGWSTKNPKTGITIVFGSANYTTSGGQSGKDILTGSTMSGGYEWIITDGGGI